MPEEQAVANVACRHEEQLEPPPPPPPVNGGQRPAQDELAKVRAKRSGCGGKLLDLNFEGTKVATNFPLKAYEAMRDDEDRTGRFEDAIRWRLSHAPPCSLVVLEIGTGALALLALYAARQGARHVYAVEANPQAAAAARERVHQAGLDGRVSVLEGLSTQLRLPEPVDVLIAEIFGSIATEEGAVTTLRDARRFLRRPDDPDSWIPSSVQTYCMPVFFSRHEELSPKELEVPYRACTIDLDVHCLAEPLLVESLSFDQASTLADKWWRQLEFRLHGPLMLSGFSLFVRVDFVATPAIEFQDSTTWQQVIPLLGSGPELLDKSEQDVRVELSADLTQLPARYRIVAEVKRAWT